MLNRLFSKTYVKKQLAVVILSIISILLAASIPFLFRELISGISNSGKASGILMLSIVAILFARKVMDFIFNYNFNVVSVLVSHDMRNRLMKQLLDATIPAKLTIDNSVIQNKLLSEVYSYGDIIGTAPIMLIINIMMLVVSAFVLCNINAAAFLFCLLFIPIIYGLSRAMKKAIERAAEDNRKKYEVLLSAISEILNGFIDIKIFLFKNEILKKFTACNGDFHASEKRMLKIRRLYYDVSDMLFSLLPILCLIFLLFLTVRGKSTIADAVAFYLYISFFIEPLSNLTNLHLNVMEGRKKIALINEVFKPLKAGEEKDDVPLSGHKITISAVDYRYKNSSIVFSPDIDITKAGLYFVEGRSGVGKSTILKLVSKILTSDTTSIFIDDNPVSALAEDQLYNYLTYINGDVAIFRGSTRENITLFGRYHYDSSVLSLLFDEDEKVLPDTSLNPAESISLSTGQLQRLNLARVLVKGGSQKIIILDEALSGLDEGREKKSIELIKNHFPASIVFVVTHRSTTKILCDYHIKVLHNTFVIEDLPMSGRPVPL